MRKKISLFLMLSLFAFIFAGCNAASQEAADSDGEVTYEAFTLDNYGREVEITKKPEKVLTLGPHITELFIALGLEDYVIGNSLDNHSRAPLPEYEEAYEAIPELTYGSATREAVISSGADFIYGIDWEFGGEGLNIEELETYGITTYVNSASTLEEIYQEILDIGKIFQVEEKATAFVEEQKERIRSVQEKIEGQGPVEVLVYDSGGSGIFTAGGSNFETLLIEYAGGRNVFEDIEDKQWATVSYEEVLEADPDVILVHDYDAPPLEQKLLDIKSDSGLSELTSVQNENFVTITLESVLPGNRVAYAIETLAEGFYPELFE